MKNIESLPADAINELLSPEIKAQMIKDLDAKIAHLSSLRSGLSGRAARASKAGKAPSQSSADTSGNTLSHKEAVNKVLGYAEFKAGATSKQIREAAKAKFDHEFSISLPTTLNKMSVAKELKTKQIEKGKRHYLYLQA
jgi:hypothetical protein